VLQICERLAAHLPVVPMAYANMAVARGPERFAHQLADAGASGVIVPDLPIDEGGEIAAALRSAGLASIPLAAPTTPEERRRRICEVAEGFVYLVSDTRTTGEREELPAGLTELIAATRAQSSVPIAVGFGIGSPKQAAAVGAVADGVIIGSRLVRAVAESSGRAEIGGAVSSFIADARAAMSATRAVG
jgi:tryptophan synthase alpha chain